MSTRIIRQIPQSTCHLESWEPVSAGVGHAHLISWIFRQPDGYRVRVVADGVSLDFAVNVSDSEIDVLHSHSGKSFFVRQAVCVETINESFFRFASPTAPQPLL